MRKTGQFCPICESCGVCRSWPAELRVKVKQAELHSAKRRIDRAEAHLAGAQARSPVSPESRTTLWSHRMLGLESGHLLGVSWSLFDELDIDKLKAGDGLN